LRLIKRQHFLIEPGRHDGNDFSPDIRLQCELR
jgi:hypothetical protein